MALSAPPTTFLTPISLLSDGVEILLDLSEGYPVVAHWGAPISGEHALDVRTLLGEAVPHADLDKPVNPGALREGARGFHGRPALQGHRGGEAWSPLFTIASVDVQGGSCTINLTDDAALLAVSLRYRILPSGVLLIDSGIVNQGATDYTVNELASWLPLPDRAAEVIDFSGRWLRERQISRKPITPGVALREGREGRTGHEHTIIQCALAPQTTFSQGEVWGAALLWSGNVRHMIEQTATGRKAIGAGELLESGEVILTPGARYDAPTMAAVYTMEGLDGVSDRLHRWLRSRPEHPTAIKPRPLTLNVWEAVYFDHNHSTLTALADVAASVGVERFVLDDGWFGSRRDDRSGLGDWLVSDAVWPDGLLPLAGHVRSLGMEFGLWFEGEMVNPDSDLYRAHPDWILKVEGRIPPTARQQLVLDLANRDCYTHILNQVDTVIREVGVAYIKWDHNRSLVDAGHRNVPAARRQTQAIYAMFDELKRRNPGLEIESCASGGGRIDLGMVMHADRFWTSDCNDALERQEIQRWTSLAIPPELLGSHIGPTESHSTGRNHSIQFRAITALFGHAGLEWNLLEATAREREAIRAWAAFYKANRGLLHGGRVTRIDYPDPGGLVHGVIAHDKSKALIAYVQARTASGSRPDAFTVPGLDPNARYRVSAREFGGAGTIQHRAPAWMAGTELTGSALLYSGLRPPVLRPEEAILVVVDRVDRL